MPGYRGHLGGAAVPIVFLLLLSLCFGWRLERVLLASLFCFLGALAPDIDTYSRARQLFFGLLFVAGVFALIAASWFVLLILFLVGLFVMLQRHRRLFHRLWFWALLGGICWLAVMSMAPSEIFSLAGIAIGSFLIGVISHLYLDGCRLF